MIDGDPEVHDCIRGALAGLTLFDRPLELLHCAHGESARALQLGRKLGLQVLAEGIESAAAWRALQAMGCHHGQGYHIACPMDKAAFLRWLAKA